MTKEELLERAEWHNDRAKYLKEQECVEAYFYHLGRADTYKFLANRLDTQGGGNP